MKYKKSFELHIKSLFLEFITGDKERNSFIPNKIEWENIKFIFR